MSPNGQEIGGYTVLDCTPNPEIVCEAVYFNSKPYIVAQPRIHFLHVK